MVSNITNINNSKESSQCDQHKKLPKEVYVIAQEIKIIKSLAGNNPKQRERQLRKLGKWFNIRSKSSFAFTDEDFLRIWKGLYYCMWMSDKPLVQENLAEDLGKLIDCFENIQVSIQFFGAFLKTMSLEWFSIDQWRMDKFLMLVRKMFRYIFYAMNKENWTKDCIEQLNYQVTSTVLEAKNVDGLTMHVADIFLEELAKVAGNNIAAELIAELIKPFVMYMARQNDIKLMGYIKNRVFYHWLWQSEKGREHNEKFNAWKEMGFPTESIHELEKVNETLSDHSEPSENETSGQKILDPRAGNVDVFVPELPVNVLPIINLIEDIQYKEVTNTKSRKILRIILEKYKTFASGEFPLGIKRIPKLNLEPMKPLIEKKVEELQNLENELYSTTRKIKKLSKKKRRKLLASIKFDDVNEDNFEEVLEAAIPSKKRTSSEWLEENIETPNKIIKIDGKGKKEPREKKAKRKQNTNREWSESVHERFESETGAISNQNENRKGDISLSDNTKDSEWNKTLEEGEIEYFIPSRKTKLKEANGDYRSQNIVLNPFAEKNREKLNNKIVLLGKKAKRHKKLNKESVNKLHVFKKKKVKIVLHKNMAQKPSDYIKQVKSSPQLPYDSRKQPTKSLLKPNLLPSPINPFYKKKIGLKLDDAL